MANRVYNFGAGPAAIPLQVLQRAQEELLDFQGLGVSVMEVSHRLPEFITLHEETLALARELLVIPDNYKVLVVHGGAYLQFSAIPMNLLPTRPAGKAVYTRTGLFADRSWEEAQKYGDISLAVDTSATGYDHLPTITPDMVDQEASYCYIVTNNTVMGTQYQTFPDTGNVPLVGDATSEIFSRPMDINKFGLLFAGGQKNLGPAGVALVIVREDLLGHPMPLTPKMIDYTSLAKDNSLTNTLNTFSVYMINLALKWIKEMGGPAALDVLNREKSSLLYKLLDGSQFYTSKVRKEDRSVMNVTFDLTNEDLNQKFVKEARDAGLFALKGHAARGGIRASIYNAMPMEGVQALAQFMAEFERTNG